MFEPYSMEGEKKEFEIHEYNFPNTFFGRFRAKRCYNSLSHATKLILPLNGVIKVATDFQANRLAFDWCYEKLGLSAEERQIEYLENLSKHLFEDMPLFLKSFNNYTRKLRLESLCSSKLRKRIQWLNVSIE